MQKKQILDLNKLLPSVVKDETLTSLISNLFNRFTSEEQSVLVDGEIGLSADSSDKISAINLEREANPLVPAVVMTNGAEQSSFTFIDLINRLKSLNADVENAQEWLKEQYFNFHVPINYDRFLNFGNYYWAGKVLNAENAFQFNPENSPDYITIARPAFNSLVKMPVDYIAISPIKLTGSGRLDEIITLEFISPTEFTVYSDNPVDAGELIVNSELESGPQNLTFSSAVGTKADVVLYARGKSITGFGTGKPFPSGVAEPNDKILEFTLQVGAAPFAIGDKFEINVKHRTSAILVSFLSPAVSGKGFITGAKSVAELMYLNGEQVTVGKRVLVTAQSEDNGIYLITDSVWQRATDSVLEEHLDLGAKVFCYANSETYTVITKTGAGSDTDPIQSNISFQIVPASPPLELNDWQVSNFWFHKDDISTLFPGLNISSVNCIRAERPIIEFDNGLQLNAMVSADGYPTDTGGISVPQSKITINQAPLYDMFYADGTHAKKVSKIFSYKETQTSAVDSVLNLRLETTDSGFSFTQSMKDSDERLMFYKNGSSLETIWVPGVTEATVSSVVKPAVGDIVISVKNTADTQSWNLTLKDGEFEIEGERSGIVGSVAPGANFECDDFQINIAVAAYVEGDKFSFNINNLLFPRYVKKQDSNFVNYPGGPTADTLGEGAWMSPARMFQNLECETRSDISYSDLADHFRSIIRNQDGFSGGSLGTNNVRNLDFSPALGGTIRAFAQNFPLLVSMLCQRDFSPLTIIDFAEQQYATALSSVDQFVVDSLPGMMAQLGQIDTNAVQVFPNGDTLKLVELFVSQRKLDTNLSEAFGDTVAKVANWPATLPMLGLVPVVIQDFAFDTELGVDVIVHHDGHISPAMTENFDVNREIAKTHVLRSDGTSSAGVLSANTPSQPYAGQFWFNSLTNDLSYFAVTFDSITTPTSGEIGQFWFNRQTSELFEWAQDSLSWVPSLTPLNSRWVKFNVHVARNNLILGIEDLFYKSVSAALVVKPHLANAEDSKYAEIELAKFAQKYGYDTYAPNYSATDAFTWNYKQATIPGVTAGIAKWFDIYADYFDNPGTTRPTSRPNIEPWKLLDNENKPFSWDSTYACTVVGTDNVGLPIKVIATSNVALSGLQIIDGVQLVAGDRVLVTAQSIPSDNKIYVASAGAWSASADVLVNGLTVVVTNGNQFARSVWVLTSPAVFEQARLWSTAMWDIISAARPGLKLCVNTFTDELLPPYVSTADPDSVNALLTTIPSGISDGYVFGDNGVVELLWKKSLEYRYGLARSAFRLNPLSFLSEAWGFDYIESYPGAIPLLRTTGTLNGHKGFVLHGEKMPRIELSSAETAALISGSITALDPNDKERTIVFDAIFADKDETIFSLSIDDTFVLQVNEGEQFSVNAFGVSFVNVRIDAKGLPFFNGDKVIIKMANDSVSPLYIPETVDGCEGCVLGQIQEVPPEFIVPGTVTYEFVAAVSVRMLGLGQWFTNMLRFSSIDSIFSEANTAYRGWELKLAHRLGAIIRDDTLRINTSQGLLPQTAYDVVIKKNKNISDIWISGLRVQLVSIGKSRLNQFGYYVPVGSADDWIFRIENYSSQNPTLERFIVDPLAPRITFSALNKANTALSWDKQTEYTGSQISTVPVNITGLQNVIDFIFSYSDRLEAAGWTNYAEGSRVTDAETGRNLDWQLEVEKLINTVYLGMSAGEAYVLNPFMSGICINTPRGLLAEFSKKNFIDAFSAQAVYDVTGARIPLSSLHVLRTDERAITYSDTPIFSGHLFVDEYEHMVLFNKKFSEAKTARSIFDGFLGARLKSARLSFTRQTVADGKPTFNGFFLSGNGMVRNIVSSVDSSANYYDASKVFNEPTTAQHSLALLGFTKKPYFDTIDVNDSTQFNFWRGMIQAKGTNMAIDAFANFKNFTDSGVDEYWAFKIAEYGDARENSQPELKVKQSDISQKYLKLQFYSSSNSSDLIPMFTHIENGDDTRWFSIDDLGKGMQFEAQSITETFSVPATTFPAYIKTRNIYHNGDSASPTISGPNSPVMIGSQMAKVFAPGIYTVSGITWLNQTKHSPVKLIDYANSVKVADFQLWHPAIGLHSQSAMGLIDISSETDPAKYNYTAQTLNNENFNTLKPWAKKEVGTVWWNTANLGYIPYYDAVKFPNRDARLQRWGVLADWASVDVFEWTESTVPPSQYDELASSQEGNAELLQGQRASGKVALKTNYFRDRIISRRPVAWSEAGVGNSNAHPSFGSQTFGTIYVSGNSLIPDTGRCADYGLTSGRRFGAWDNDKPIGEVAITAELKYHIGSSESILSPVFEPATGTVLSSFSLQPLKNAMFGQKIGAITLSKRVLSPDVFALRMTSSTGDYEDKIISDWSFSTSDSSILNVDFETFGIRVSSVRVTTVSPILAADIIDEIIGAEQDIFIRESVSFIEEIPLPTDILVTTESFTNDEDERLEWRVWTRPSQTDLNKDLSSPYNKWKPYIGDTVIVEASAAVVADMQSDSSGLVMRDGTKIKRYYSSWSEWIPLQDETSTQVPDGTTAISFSSASTIDATRVSIYADGIQVNPSQYFISGSSVSMLNVFDEGSVILFKNRAKQPTESEFAFDPEVKEDFTIQRQYKKDYEFTEIKQRDSFGNPTSSLYYFWVRDKTVASSGQEMSLLQAQTLLKNGQDSHVVLAKANPISDKNYKFAFDSCAIAGLGTYVARDNAFKFRFVRNFTLRDDPEEMNLKNVHTEWTLLRRGQSKKVPVELWNLITSAIAGVDAFGNQVPSQSRIEYDLRNGTRTRFGSGSDQIFADSDLVKQSVINTILYPTTTLKLGTRVITDYITSLDANKHEEWFSTPEKARETMATIFGTARASQINEIFFNVLDDALANNFELTDMFKTSLITVSSATNLLEATSTEQQDEQY